MVRIKATKNSLRLSHEIPMVITGDGEKMVLERMARSPPRPPSWEISKLVSAASNDR